jgi:CMP-N,N'-diacetyllegionaminic acid synthase
MRGPILGLIPARAGSKGIPGKNLRRLAGRPLIEYAIAAARESAVIERIVLSTDSQEIADVGRHLGADVPFLRPATLARDDSPMYGVVRHAIERLELEGWRAWAVAVLQPTAPMRRPEHVRHAVEIMDAEGCSSVVSVIEIPAHYSPDYAMRIEGDRLVNFMREGSPITRRQDAVRAYSRDGTIYLVRRDVVIERRDLYGEDCRPLILQPSESVNLDTLEDWTRAERALSE